jgi:hypothetical protein
MHTVFVWCSLGECWETSDLYQLNYENYGSYILVIINCGLYSRQRNLCDYNYVVCESSIAVLHPCLIVGVYRFFFLVLSIVEQSGEQMILSVCVRLTAFVRRLSIRASL